MWDFSTGSNEVIVGVMDTGIDGTHPDLQDSILNNLCRDFTSGEAVEVSIPLDPNGHGTHVAGIIGAIGNNNVGVTGTNWNVGLVSLRVFDEFGNGYSSYVAEAIEYAERNNIPILNLSAIWFESSLRYDVALDTIINNYSGLIVCAAGNDGIDNDSNNPALPASYSCENIVSVGAIDENDERSVWNLWQSSNYGTNTVDIYAPGSNIVSTYPENMYDSSKDNHIARGYYNTGGTSMAAPFVAGVAALLLSVNQDLTTIQLKYAILNSAETISITIPNGTSQSVKKLNAFNAIKYVMRSQCSFYELKYNDKHISKTIDGTSTYFMENTAMIRLGVQSEYNYSFTISSTVPINVTIYDYNLNILSFSPTYSNGNCKVEFNKYLVSSEYYLKINYVDETVSGTINVTIYGPPHQHSYTGWIYNDRISHIEVCDCGSIGTKTEAHMISQADLLKPKARCLGCKALLDMGGNGDIGMVPGILSTGVNIITENGSYILPNEIIVLVEEDIEAYLNGTLIIHDEDKTLVTQ